MKYLIILLLLTIMSCAEQEKSCEDNPHQLKCPGHENHGHSE